MFQKANKRLKKNKRSPKETGEEGRARTSQSRNSKQIHKRIFISIAVVAAAITVPYIFALAADTNQVENMAKISVQPIQSAAPTPTPSPSPSPSVTASGELTSDLTESVAWAAAPTPGEDAVATPIAEASAEAIYATITPGTDEPFVALIQQRLMDLEYMEADEPTTLFGPVTSQAIQYFQRKNGLAEDGIAGVETQTVLFSANAKKYTVSEGASGPDVQSIQDRLKELGYSVGNTGYFGTDTSKAVKYFQRMNGLSDDGNVGSDTREMLYSTGAEPSVEYTKSHSSSSNSGNSSGNSGGSSAGSSNSSSNSSGNSNSGSSSGSGNSGSGGSSAKPAANPGNSEAFVQAALSLLGKPYVWGGKGPNVFDCSGFVYYALKLSGNGIGYMTSAGWHNSSYPKVSSMSDLQRGDVIDYRGHVGIYLGDGTMVDASSSQGKIRITSINSSYWVKNFLEGRRIF